MICTFLDHPQNKEERKQTGNQTIIPNAASSPLTKMHYKERISIQEYLL